MITQQRIAHEDKCDPWHVLTTIAAFNRAPHAWHTVPAPMRQLRSQGGAQARRLPARSCRPSGPTHNQAFVTLCEVLPWFLPSDEMLTRARRESAAVPSREIACDTPRYRCTAAAPSLPSTEDDGGGQPWGPGDGRTPRIPVRPWKAADRTKPREDRAQIILCGTSWPQKSRPAGPALAPTELASQAAQPLERTCPDN